MKVLKSILGLVLAAWATCSFGVGYHFITVLSGGFATALGVVFIIVSVIALICNFLLVDDTL